MGLFIPPKTWTTEVLASADMNALTAAIANAVNSIINAQINAGAAIQGSKLASEPLGIPTTKINNRAVTLAKLAVGASLASNVQASAGTPASFDATDGITILKSQNVTVTGRNGLLLVIGIWSGSLQPDSADRTLESYLVRTGGAEPDLTGDTVLQQLNVIGSDFGGQHPVAFSMVGLDPSPGTGSKTYALKAQLTSGTAADIVTVDEATLVVLELA